MNEALRRLTNNLLESGKDLLPIVLVIAFFQIAVLQRPIPDFSSIALGTFYILIGLTLFISGLRTGLFPIGESLAHAFVKRGSLLWLLVFAFALGFGTTIAEPALIAIANEAADVAAVGGIISHDQSAVDNYASTLRITVAIAVGLAVVLGVIRILKGWSIQWLIIGGYLLVLLTTLLAPEWIIGIAYDSGGVTTSTITVPLVTALGVGLASGIRGRNPLTDGFGMIAICSLLPIIAVMIFGILL
ncbi:MAG TPA: DUF1538 domain-containing protein [Candidatus Thioglobus sp.]|jgi:hypothetical protein|nr:DUF1538 domain-containing protein [Candidatus Thioglobus sp.]HIL20100.1 DUF1538 domain-containing protein [Candidatus Thioglobus sp.]